MAMHAKHTTSRSASYNLKSCLTLKIVLTLKQISLMHTGPEIGQQGGNLIARLGF